MGARKGIVERSALGPAITAMNAVMAIIPDAGGGLVAPRARDISGKVLRVSYAVEAAPAHVGVVAVAKKATPGRGPLGALVRG